MTVLDNYPFKTRPFAHQYTVIDNSWNREAFALHLEMGLGKTKITTDTMGMLWLQDKITHALILAPAGVYQNWQKELDAHLPNEVPRKVHTWMRLTSQKEREAFDRMVADTSSGDLKILLLNVEALSTKKGFSAAKAFIERIPGQCLMAIDESTSIKNPKALRTKSAVELGQLPNVKYRRVLSGLPTPNTPLDIFAPVAVLSGRATTLRGFKNYYAFRSRFTVEKTMQFGSRRAFKQVVAYRRLDELHEKLDDFSARLTKADCLDLPEKIYLTREAPLTPEQKKLYTALKKETMAEIKGQKISSSLMITRLLRFQQLACGHIGTDEGEVVDVPSTRMAALLETLEESEGKVVIWAHFRHSIQAITAELSKVYGKESVAAYYGDTSTKERVEINTNFQDPEHPLRFFVGNPATAGYGIDLTASNLCIYYSRDFRLDTRMQSEDRLHRIGQKNSVTYVDIVSPNIIDERVLKALRSKMKLSAEILGEKAPQWL